MRDENFCRFVLDQLDEMNDVHARPMFGGFGLYRGETFFGLISSDGRLYFKTDAATREEYVAQGMGPFRANERLTLKSYYEAPADVLEDPDRLADWAEKAVEIVVVPTTVMAFLVEIVVTPAVAFSSASVAFALACSTKLVRAVRDLSVDCRRETA